MRWNDNKLLNHYKTGKTELYDFLIDIGENDDLSKQNPELISKLTTLLRN
jgi:hypothetical protein